MDHVIKYIAKFDVVNLSQHQRRVLLLVMRVIRVVWLRNGIWIRVRLSVMGAELLVLYILQWWRGDENVWFWVVVTRNRLSFVLALLVDRLCVNVLLFYHHFDKDFSHLVCHLQPALPQDCINYIIDDDEPRYFELNPFGLDQESKIMECCLWDTGPVWSEIVHQLSEPAFLVYFFLD